MNNQPQLLLVVIVYMTCVCIVQVCLILGFEKLLYVLSFRMFLAFYF